MALTTKESAHLLRIEQMTHIIVQKNGELLYQDEGYKDFSVIGNMSEINVSVFKLEKGYQYYKKNIGRTIRAFEDLDVEFLEDFDNKLVGIIKQYEIPLELKSVEELTDLIYGFPNQEYRDVNNTFSFIWGFLNEVQRHDLIAKYAEYTGWKFLKYRSGILCGAVYGLGVGLVNTVKALWDLIIMLYNFEVAYLGQLKDHFIDLRGSLEDDLKWLEHSSNIIATVSKSIFDDPGIILEFFSATWEMFNGFIDSTTAEWMEKEPFDQGISVGTNIGQGLFEIIIAVIGTKGVDKVAKLAKSGKFVALLEKMNLGRLNKLISKVDELKKLKAASTGLSKMDGLVLSTNGKERVVDLLTEFDNVDDVIAKLSKLGNDFPQIVDKLTDTDELTIFISKIDNLEADKLDELTNIVNHLDDYPNVTIDDIITQDVDNLFDLSKATASNIDEIKDLLGKDIRSLTSADFPNGYQLFDMGDDVWQIRRKSGTADDLVARLTTNEADEVIFYTGVVSNRISSSGKLRRLLLSDLNDDIIKLLEKKLHEAHHLVPDAVVRKSELFELATEYGYQIDRKTNGILLPKSTDDIIIGFSDNLPLHSGAHKNYNKTAERITEDLFDDLLDEFGDDIPKEEVLNAISDVEGLMFDELTKITGKLN